MPLMPMLARLWVTSQSAVGKPMTMLLAGTSHHGLDLSWIVDLGYLKGWQKIGWMFRVIRGRRRLIRRIMGRVDIWVFISPVVASIKGFT